MNDAATDRKGGKVVLLNIWATWCGPCRAEMPTLDRLEGELGLFGLPSTILIGPDGRELGRFVGPAEWDTPETTAFLRAVVAKYN